MEKNNIKPSAKEGRQIWDKPAMDKSKDEGSKSLQRVGLSNEEGKPPFADLQILIEAAGYEVLLFEAEGSGPCVSGSILMRIAPKEWLKNLDFMSFPQVPQGLILTLREYTARPPRQLQGMDE